MLSSQAKSATSLLTTLQSQQASASRQAAEYTALFLAKQEAYSKLMRQYTALQHAQQSSSEGQGDSPAKRLQEEVRRRLSEKLIHRGGTVFR